MLDQTTDAASTPQPKPQVTLPPPYTCISRHVVMPQATHDETAHMNFLLSLTSHLGSKVAPRMKAVYEKRVAPEFEKERGRTPTSSREVRDAMLKNPMYQSWSALRRNAQEMRQQIGRFMTFRQIEQVNAVAKSLNAGSNKLQLDPSLELPGYVTQVDNHCAPGGYVAALNDDDVSVAANYEAGHFVIAGGGTGGKSDALGRSLAAFIQAEYPNLNPKKILDVGAGGGFNTLPLAVAFPDADVIALDVAAPMLRYGHARAKAMGVNNVTFRQASGEHLPYDDNSMDLVITAMLWHETSLTGFRNMIKEIYRVLRPGGLFLNFEQPNFDETTPVFERFMRDWDSWYNAEPFWAKLHTLSYTKETASAGFEADKVFERWAPKVTEPNAFPVWAQPVGRHEAEHKMIDARKEGGDTPAPKKAGPLYFFGAVK
ncbi:MAG: class I SAM-dependent methyltransferase [Rhodospirillaceae bacterium]|nr:class I SAM-dependent methyltransferase [Rhodospirillaceae bacterium]